MSSKFIFLETQLEEWDPDRDFSSLLILYFVPSCILYYLSVCYIFLHIMWILSFINTQISHKRISIHSPFIIKNSLSNKLNLENSSSVIFKSTIFRELCITQKSIIGTEHPKPESPISQTGIPITHINPPAHRKTPLQINSKVT